jgi:small subunit ribosomal protein S8e
MILPKKSDYLCTLWAKPISGEDLYTRIISPIGSDSMSVWQGVSRRKSTGARLKGGRKKRKFELGGEHKETKIGVRKATLSDTRGGNPKLKLTVAEHANVLDKKKGVCKKVKITGVSENPANQHYVRRNIITKGAIIETEAGKAKVLSSPGQDGNINAVLI